ncbi:MAG: ATP-binding protein [Deltaproteobacteria bacterium]
MTAPATEHELLAQIPSPTKRLWFGMGVILAIFLGFAIYTTYEVRWLESFQANVVQQNRKASLQLLRLQDDAYLLAISIRDMVYSKDRYPIRDRRAEFSRLREDMDHALGLEGQYGSVEPASEDKRAQLRTVLSEFWRSADAVFNLSERGKESEARELIQTDLEPQRAMITETVSRLLILNDRAQVNAAEKIAEIYSEVKREILLLIAVLFLMALVTGLYTLQANRRTFERLQHLAERLQAQSEQLRKLSWKLIEVQENTLRHVARDLHDEFGQILTAVGVMLGRASQHGLDDKSEFIEEVQRVKKIVEDTLQNVRDASQMFRPAILDDFGLEQTLEWFASQFARQTGIKVHFDGNSAGQLVPSNSAIHIYRIVQAALANVARHSGAHEAWVSLTNANGSLALEIRDDGEGFDPDADMDRTSGEGMGLMGMRERTEHLKGTIVVRSAPGRGTMVRIEIPLESLAAPQAAEKAG